MKISLGSCSIVLAALTSACSDAPTTPPAETMTVSVDELVKAYEDNEAAAQAKYGGKVLRLTSAIGGVKLNDDDRPFVNLAWEDTLLPVQLSFAAAHEAEASYLEKGKTYTFDCMSVSEVLGTPMLSDCEVQNDTFTEAIDAKQ